MKTKINILISIATLFLLCSDAYSWDTRGHKYSAKLFKQYSLNNNFHQLKAETLDYIIKWSSMPDSFVKWDKFKSYSFYPEEKKLMLKFRLKHPYSFHSPRGQALSFIFLCNAIKKNRNKSKAFWIASLLHSMSDASSSNHDPVMHYIMYTFIYNYKMEIKNHFFDFSCIQKNNTFNKKCIKLLNNFKGQHLNKSPEEMLLWIMNSGNRGSQYLLARSKSLSSAINYGMEKKYPAKVLNAIAQLGIHSIEQTIIYINAAYYYVNHNKIPVLNEQIIKKYTIIKDNFLAKIDVSKWQSNKSTKIAILVEPMGIFNDWKLNISNSYISTAIINCLQKANIPVQALNIYKLENGMEIPKNISLLIVLSGRFKVKKELKDQINNFSKRNGKLLWIGGLHKDLLGDISKKLIKSDRKSIAVFDQYGNTNNDFINNATIILENDFCNINNNNRLKFIHNPNTKTGMQRPVCPYKLNPKSQNHNIICLAKSESNGNISQIAIAEKINKQYVKIFIPEYLIAPYLYVRPIKNTDFSIPHLDKIGSEILLKSINMLTNTKK